MSQKRAGRVSNALDWIAILAGAIVSFLIGQIGKFLLSRVRADWYVVATKVKRGTLTVLGVVYVCWFFLAIAAWIVSSANAAGQLGFASANWFAYWVQITFGMILMVGIPGFGLEHLAKRWEPSHWVARMASGRNKQHAVERKKTQGLRPGRKPLWYIQVLPKTTGSL